MFMFFRLDYMIGQFEVVDVFILNFSLNHQMFNIPVFDSNHIHKMFNRQFFDSKCKFATKKIVFPKYSDTSSLSRSASDKKSQKFNQFNEEYQRFN